MFYIPPWTGTLGQWLTAIFATLIPFLFLNEAKGWLSFGYSKFAKREQRFSVPSKAGMIIIYLPAVVAYPVVHVLGGAPATAWQLTAMLLLSAHFAKRCVETLVVHKYSGVMNGWTVATVCALYTCASWLLGHIATFEISPELVASAGFETWLPLGVVIWVLGEAINLQHHVLLSNLRKPGETGYKLPKGGLFRYVACPHYLGEIIAWIGYSIVFQHISALVITAIMTAYLLGRAHNTVKWYRERIEGVPASWKRVIPFVY